MAALDVHIFIITTEGLLVGTHSPRRCLGQICSDVVRADVRGAFT